MEGPSVGSELLGLIVGVSDGDRVGDAEGLAEGDVLGLALGLNGYPIHDGGAAFFLGSEKFVGFEPGRRVCRRARARREIWKVDGVSNVSESGSGRDGGRSSGGRRAGKGSDGR
eukprot:scaffold9371_cov66-Cyclotella_meneghiniana.AAC.6